VGGGGCEPIKKGTKNQKIHGKEGVPTGSGRKKQLFVWGVENLAIKTWPGKAKKAADEIYWAWQMPQPGGKVKKEQGSCEPPVAAELGAAKGERWSVNQRKGRRIGGWK